MQIKSFVCAKVAVFVILLLLFASCKVGLQTNYIEKQYTSPVTIESSVNEDGSVSVSMSTQTEGATIFYTTDGSFPNTKSLEYKRPLAFTESVTISAMAVKSELENSSISRAEILITEKNPSDKTGQSGGDGGNAENPDEEASCNYLIDLSKLLIKQESEINYIWKSGVKTEDYNSYIYNLDLTPAFMETYGHLPQKDEKVRVTWRGTCSESLPASALQLKLIDANTKTAEWAKTRSNTEALPEITADKDFIIDCIFTLTSNPLEKVRLNFSYPKDALDSLVTFKLSGLHSAFSKDFELAPSGDVIINPHKGFVMYAWSPDYLENIYGTISLASGKNPAWDYCSVVYTGCGWNSVQKDWNEFDWSTIDKMLELCANSGRTLGWRIYPVNSTARADDVPQFIYDAGCKFVMATIKGTTEQLRVPDWSDPIYLQACKSFADEISRRYDGDRRVEFIDIRCFGNWGEWHCSQLEGSEMPSEEIQKEMIAYYASVFKSTQLVVPSDCKGEVYDFALSIGVAKRDDGLVQIKDREEVLAKCYQAGLPTVGENCSEYEDMLKLDDSDRWHRKWTLERWKNVINTAHLSYYELDRGGYCGRVFLEDNLQAVKEMNNKLGYNFEVISAKLTYDDDLNLLLSVTIKNTGLAPAFFDVNLIADITDSSGKRKYQLGSTKQIKKGSFTDGDEKTFVFSDLSFDCLKPLCDGDCICLGLYEDCEDENPTVKFDNKNTLANNKLRLGRL